MQLVNNVIKEFRAATSRTTMRTCWQRYVSADGVPLTELIAREVSY